MASIVHLIVFILIWPISPVYVIFAYDIESWFYRFLICGAFGPLAFIGATLVTMAIIPQDRKQFRERWKADKHA